MTFTLLPRKSGRGGGGEEKERKTRGAREEEEDPFPIKAIKSNQNQLTVGLAASPKRIPSASYSNNKIEVESIDGRAGCLSQEDYLFSY